MSSMKRLSSSFSRSRSRRSQQDTTQVANPPTAIEDNIQQNIAGPSQARVENEMHSTPLSNEEPEVPALAPGATSPSTTDITPSSLSPGDPNTSGTPSTITTPPIPLVEPSAPPIVPPTSTITSTTRPSSPLLDNIISVLPPLWAALSGSVRPAPNDAGFFAAGIEALKRSLAMRLVQSIQATVRNGHTALLAGTDYGIWLVLSFYASEAYN